MSIGKDKQMISSVIYDSDAQKRDCNDTLSPPPSENMSSKK